MHTCSIGRAGSCIVMYTGELQVTMCGHVHIEIILYYICTLHPSPGTTVCSLMSSALHGALFTRKDTPPCHLPNWLLYGCLLLYTTLLLWFGILAVYRGLLMDILTSLTRSLPHPQHWAEPSSTLSHSLVQSIVHPEGP